MSVPLFLGIDLGGTNIKAGVVDDSGTSRSRISIPTLADKGGDHGVERLAEAGNLAMKEADITANEIGMVGLATPGTMDIPAGMLLDPPNLPGWENLPVRDRVAEALSLPTVLQNDANAAAYGEWWVGAGREANSVVLWTLGTGVGGGIIVGDMIIRGEHSCGSECGHVIIQMDGGRFLEGTGQYGTVEAYCSAKSLIKRCEETLATGVNTAIRGRVDAGEELTPILLGECAEAGDEIAETLIMDTAMYLGVGTTTVMHVINPDMFLIGGAMTFGRNKTPLGRRFLDRIKHEVQTRGFPVPAQRTVIDYATLGGDAGYIGAAGWARHKWREDSRSPQ